jgi:hypothetical protein
MNNSSTSLDEIKCPKCGEIIPVSEALYHQIEERTREEFETEITEQKKSLIAKEAELKQREQSLESQVAARVQESQAGIKKESEKKAREELAVELEALKQQADEKGALLKKSQEAELELRKKTRELEEREKTLALETQRKIDEERKAIEEKTEKRVQEQYHLKDAEKDKKLRDALVANDDLRRKLEQGSQQTQGEVLELELESLIRNAFPTDNVEPVPKGIAGADVVQRIVHKNGHECGTILWELKRTKAWSDGWITKFKDDQRAMKADLAILVSEALPKNCKHFIEINGIWVTSAECALSLATALRQSLVEISMTKLAGVGKNEKMEVLYQYLSGPEFKQRVEAIVESFVEMQNDLQQERRAAERAWSKREKQLQRVITNTSGMYGDFQGLIGSSLQAIPALTAGDQEESDE